MILPSIHSVSVRLQCCRAPLTSTGWSLADDLGVMALALRNQAELEVHDRVVEVLTAAGGTFPGFFCRHSFHRLMVKIDSKRPCTPSCHCKRSWENTKVTFGHARRWYYWLLSCLHVWLSCCSSMRFEFSRPRPKTCTSNRQLAFVELFTLLWARGHQCVWIIQ